MKTFAILCGLLSILGPVSYAGDHEPKRHKHYKQGPAGPQGPQGDKGLDGKDGQNGRDGDDGYRSPAVNVGADVRWYDAKRFDVRSGYRYDVRNGGHTVDAIILGFKFGKSYEEKLIDSVRGALSGQEEYLREQSLLNGQMTGDIRNIQDQLDKAKGTAVIIRGAK